MFEKILLTVDGSEHSLRAAQTAGDLARAVQAKELRVVVAYDPVPAFIGDPYLQRAIDARLKDSQEVLGKALETVGKIPGEINTETLEGSPAEVIINVAATRESDLIVMGSRGAVAWQALYSVVTAKRWLLTQPVRFSL